MRLLRFFFRVAIFLLVMIFALANTHPVTVTLIPGIQGLTFEAPMMVWVLGIFLAGIFACLFLLLPTLVRGWRRSRDGT